ncbi:MAG: hypothetical protein C5S47_01755 [Candidatus Methanogasteraceae archaeon]|nr:MAG: hypothetical protein C5S47_01755 [ANME-2 cluster archaeon]
MLKNNVNRIHCMPPNITIFIVCQPNQVVPHLFLVRKNCKIIFELMRGIFTFLDLAARNFPVNLSLIDHLLHLTTLMHPHTLKFITPDPHHPEHLAATGAHDPSPRTQSRDGSTTLSAPT